MRLSTNNAKKGLTVTRIFSLIATSNEYGSIAQSVEQRIENPCVGSSILPRATICLPHM